MKKHWITFGLSLTITGALFAEEGAKYAKIDKEDLTVFQCGQIALAAGTLLQNGHYRQILLSDEISRTQFTNFLNSLDYNRMIFLQSDVDRLAKQYADKLDDATRGADAMPAFEIYELFKKRLAERYEYAQTVYDDEFDFNQDEYFELQRNKRPWPATKEEADNVWRLRIKNDFLVGRLNKDKPEETLDIITKRYRRLNQTLSDFDREEVLGIYLDALGNAFDPHSDYMTPSERKNFEIHSIKNELTGIGAMLQNVDGYCTIKALTPGGPAEESKKLHPEDRIVAVAQGNDGEWVDVIEEKLDNVVEIIRGAVGSKVRLEVIPAKGDSSVRKTIELVRDVIKIQDQLPKAKLFVHPVEGGKDMRLGVVTLPTFHEHAAADVAALVSRLKEEKIDGLVLDLRRNGGGILDQAIQLAGLFIDQGPVVQVKNSRVQLVLRDPIEGSLYDGPMIVLVSHLSASASEIVAAALQDYGRALIVGDDHTHGKGTVQTLVGLKPFLRPDVVEEPGDLKFTVQKFYRIAGGTTQKYGVTPDYTLPSTYDYLEMGERFLPNALEADEIEKADYQTLNRVAPYLKNLADHSHARLAKDQEFNYIAEDIELLKAQLADRRVSLNEPKRLEEKNEAKQILEARKTYRASLKSTDENVFEIDLEGVEKGGPMLSMAEIKIKEGEALAAVDPQDVPVKLTVDGEDAEDVEEAVHVDAHLDETLNVLSDYVQLLRAAAAGENVVFSK